MNTGNDGNADDNDDNNNKSKFDFVCCLIKT
jgi:hypothetical protein